MNLASRIYLVGAPAGSPAGSYAWRIRVTRRRALMMQAMIQIISAAIGKNKTLASSKMATIQVKIAMVAAEHAGGAGLVGEHREAQCGGGHAGDAGQDETEAVRQS